MIDFLKKEWWLVLLTISYIILFMAYLTEGRNFLACCWLICFINHLILLYKNYKNTPKN